MAERPVVDGKAGGSIPLIHPFNFFLKGVFVIDETERRQRYEAMIREIASVKNRKTTTPTDWDVGRAVRSFRIKGLTGHRHSDQGLGIKLSDTQVHPDLLPDGMVKKR